MFHHTRDNLLLHGLRVIAVVSLAILFFIIFFLVSESSIILGQINPEQYFFDENWHPSENEFLLLPMILGSLFVCAGAMLLSAPLGIFSAILCQFYAPAWFSIAFQRTIEVLAGMPSVVYGFWGVMIVVPLIAQIQAPGTSLLAGIIVLMFIIMPTITIIANNALQDVDKDHIRGAIALGLSRYSIIRHIIFPQARRGLLTGIILQSGRAIGETLAVLMVCGNVVQIPTSLFDPVRTLTSNIALEMSYAMDLHRSALFLSGLFLMILVLALILLAEKIELSGEPT